MPTLISNSKPHKVLVVNLDNLNKMVSQVHHKVHQEQENQLQDNNNLIQDHQEQDHSGRDTTLYFS